MITIKLRNQYTDTRIALSWKPGDTQVRIAGDPGDGPEDGEGMILRHFQTPMSQIALDGQTPDKGKEVTVDPLSSEDAFRYATALLAPHGWLK